MKDLKDFDDTRCPHMAGHARPKAAEEPVMRSVATSVDPAFDSAARDMHPV